MVAKNLISKILFILVLLKSLENKLITFAFNLIVFSEHFYLSILKDAKSYTKCWNKIGIKNYTRINKILYNVKFLTLTCNKYVLII